MGRYRVRAQAERGQFDVSPCLGPSPLIAVSDPDVLVGRSSDRVVRPRSSLYTVCLLISVSLCYVRQQAQLLWYSFVHKIWGEVVKRVQTPVAARKRAWR